MQLAVNPQASTQTLCKARSMAGNALAYYIFYIFVLADCCHGTIIWEDEASSREMFSALVVNMACTASFSTATSSLANKSTWSAHATSVVLYS